VRIIIGLALLTLTSLATAEALDKALQQCRTIESGDQRLDCYDAIGRQQDSTSLPSSVNSTTAEPTKALATKALATKALTTKALTTKAPAKDNSELFGFEARQITKQVPDRINVEVIKANTVHGKKIFQLSNGQVWKQIDTKRFVFSQTKGQAYIERGALGSFFFSQQNSNTRIRVKRVK
jgi:hypothetical protein